MCSPSISVLLYLSHLLSNILMRPQHINMYRTGVIIWANVQSLISLAPNQKALNNVATTEPLRKSQSNNVTLYLH